MITITMTHEAMRFRAAPILARCTVDDATGCWVWRGAVSRSNDGTTVQARIWAPDYSLDRAGKIKKALTGTRAAWTMTTREPIPEGLVIFKRPACHDLCVNPAHLHMGTREEWGQMMASDGVWKAAPKRVTANRATGLKRAKLTPEQVAEIQASEESGVALSQRLGVPRSLISRVRRGELVYARQRNPFGGLLGGGGWPFPSRP